MSSIILFASLPTRLSSSNLPFLGEDLARSDIRGDGRIMTSSFSVIGEGEPKDRTSSENETTSQSDVEFVLCRIGFFHQRFIFIKIGLF